jgi:hypothetical protein
MLDQIVFCLFWGYILGWLYIGLIYCIGMGYAYIADFVLRLFGK